MLGSRSGGTCGRIAAEPMILLRYDNCGDGVLLVFLLVHKSVKLMLLLLNNAGGIAVGRIRGGICAVQRR